MSRKLDKNHKLNPLDRRILNRMQKDIPFVSRPWKSMAKELNINEDLLLGRIAFLKKEGLIRKTAAVFNSGAIGFSSTLVAAKINPRNLKSAAHRINAYPEVTHNYARDCEYNLWFTLVARGRKRIGQILSRLKRDKDIEAIFELPAVKLFKINVNLKV